MKVKKLNKQAPVSTIPCLLAEEDEGVYEELKPDDLIFYNVKDVARMLLCSAVRCRPHGKSCTGQTSRW